MSITEPLKKIGLEELQVGAYNVLIALGAKTAEEVALHLKKDLSEITEALDELVEKGFVKKIAGKVDLYIALAPSIVLTAEAEKKLEEELKGISGDVEDIWKNAKVSLDTVTNNLIDSLNQKMLELMNAIETPIKEISGQFGAIFTKFSTDLRTNSNNAGELITKEAAEKYADLEAHFSSLRDDIENTMKEQLEVLEKSARDVSQAIIDALNGFKEGRTSLIQDYFNHVKEGIEKALNNLSESVQNSLTSVESLSEEIKNRLKAQQDEMKAGIETTSLSWVDKRKTTLDSLLGRVTKILEDFNSSAKLELEKLVNSSLDFEKEVKSSLEGAQESFNMGLEEEIEKGKNSLIEAKEEVNSKLQDTVQNLQENVSKKGEETRQAIEDSSAGWNAIIEEHKNILQILGGKVSEYEGLEQVRMKDIKGEVTSFVEDNAQKTREILEDVREKSDQINALLRQELVQTLNIIFGNMVNENKAKVEASSSKIEEKKQESLDRIKDICGKAIKEITDLKEKNLGIVGQQNEKISSEVDVNAQNIENAIEKTLQSLLSKIQTTVSETENITKNTINTTMKETEESITQSTNKIQEMIQKETSDLASKNEESKGMIASEFSILKESMKKFQEEDLKQKMNEGLKAHLQSINETTKNHENSLLKTIKEVTTNIEKEAAKLKADIPPSLELLLTDQMDAITQFDLTLFRELTNFQKVIEELQPVFDEKMAKKAFGKERAPEIYQLIQGLNIAARREEMKNLVNKHKTDFKEKVSSFLDKLSRSLTDQEKTAQKMNEEESQKIAKIFSELRENSGEIVNNSEREVLESAGNLINDLILSVENGHEELTSALEGSKEAQIKILNDANQQGIETLTGVKNKIVDVFQSGLKDADSLQNAVIENAEKSCEEMKQETGGLISSSSGNMKTILESAKSDLEGVIEAIMGNLKKDVEDLEANSGETATLTAESLNKMLKEFEGGSFEWLQSIQETITETMDQKLGTGETGGSEIATNGGEKGEIEAEVSLEEDLRTLIDGMVSEGVNSLIEKKNEGIKKVEDIVKETENKNRDLTQALKTGVEDAENRLIEVRTHLEKAKKAMEELEIRIKETVDLEKGRMEQLVNTIGGFIDKTSEEVFLKIEGIKQSINQVIENIKTNVDEMEEKVREFSTVTETLEKEKIGLMEQGRQEIGEVLKEPEDKITDLLNKIREIIDTKEGEIRNLVSSDIETVKGAIKDGEKILKDPLEAQEGKISEITEKHLAELERTTENFTSRADVVSMEPVRRIKDQAINSLAEITSLISKHSLTLKETLYSSAENIRKTLEDYTTSAETTIGNVKNNAENELKTSHNNIKQDVETLENSITKDMQQTNVAVTQQMSKKLQEVPLKIQEALGATKSTTEFLKEIQNIAVKIEPLPIEQTYRIAGKDAPINVIKGMMARTKSTITILIPEIKALPLELIEDVSARKRVHILSNIQPEDMEYAQKIKKERPSIQIRTNPALEIIGATRDSEEIAIGSINTPEKIELITTTNEELVKFLYELITSTHAKSRPI